MRYFFDTEFQDTGTSIDLISIGICNDRNNDTLYCVSNEFNLNTCDDWVCANVISKLPPPEERVCRREIRKQIKEYTDRNSDLSKPIEFWAYFASYDWVAFCQLFGGMLNLPLYYPQFVRDLKQEMMNLNISKAALPFRDVNMQHNALVDALWLRKSYDIVMHKTRLL